MIRIRESRFGKSMAYGVRAGSVNLDSNQTKRKDQWPFIWPNIEYCTLDFRIWLAFSPYTVCWTLKMKRFPRVPTSYPDLAQICMFIGLLLGSCESDVNEGRDQEIYRFM